MSDIRKFFGSKTNGTKTRSPAKKKDTTALADKRDSPRKTAKSSKQDASKTAVEKNGKRKAAPVLLSTDDESDFEQSLPVKKAKNAALNVTPSRPKKGSVLSDSDDDKPVATKRKVATVLSASSDDEDTKTKASKRKKPLHKNGDTANSSFTKLRPSETTPKGAGTKNGNTKERPTPKLSQISVSDYFGGSSNRPARNTPVKAETVVAINSTTEKRKVNKYEKEKHNDREFLAAIDQAESDFRSSTALDLTDSPKQSSGTPKKSKLAKTPEPAADAPSPAKRSARTPKKTEEASKVPLSSQKKSSTVTAATSIALIVKEDGQKLITPSKPSNSHDDSIAAKKVSTKKQTPAKASTSVEHKTPTSANRSFNYRQYKERAGPSALGSKPIPEGAENCLEGKTFVISGVLDSIERDDAKLLIEKHGGRVTTGVSKRTTYLVTGREAGEKKLEEAKKNRTIIIDEDGLFDLIRNTPGKLVPLPKKITTPKKVQRVSADTKTSEMPSRSTTLTVPWVDKYKPTSMKQILGQQGDRSCMNKLLVWLKNWPKWHVTGELDKKRGKGASDDGSIYKAALLSGPPGVGKTTTALLTCQELGLSVVERNASDTRNKKQLENVVSECLSSHSITEYGGSKSTAKRSHNTVTHVLIMDEVDGMSGNEDRAGMAELIALIKRTKIPIICICNDRQSQKIRSLTNYCYDLRFHRPQTQQLRSAMMSIAFKEGLKLPGPAMDQIIEGAGHDVRQILNHLNLLAASKTDLTFDEARAAAKAAKKDESVQSVFEIARLLLSDNEETRKMSLIDKADLFFTDYDMVPLFIEENYPSVVTHKAGSVSEHLSSISRAVDLMAYGDTLDRQIRSDQTWSLLSDKAMLSTVLPCEIIKGHVGGAVRFPSWFGNFSKHNRLRRQANQLQIHSSLKTSSDVGGWAMDYAPVLRLQFAEALTSNKIKDVVSLLDNYEMTRDDMDTMLELSLWPNREDFMDKLSSSTKSAFTKAYNKATHHVSYALPITANVAKRNKGGASGRGKKADNIKKDEADEEVDNGEEETPYDDPNSYF